VFLLPNATSKLQYLDQGIIKVLKQKYRKFGFTILETNEKNIYSYGIKIIQFSNISRHLQQLNRISKMWKQFNHQHNIIIILKMSVY
jgi:hypothetical protein